MASISKWKREVKIDSRALPQKLERPSTNEEFDAKFEKEDQRVGRDERRCIRNGRQRF